MPVAMFAVRSLELFERWNSMMSSSSRRLALWAGPIAILAGLAALRWLTTDPANAIAAGFLVLAIVYLVAIAVRVRLLMTVPVAMKPLTGPGALRVGIRNLLSRPAEFYVKAHLVARRNDGGGQPGRISGSCSRTRSGAR